MHKTTHHMVFTGVVLLIGIVMLISIYLISMHQQTQEILSKKIIVAKIAEPIFIEHSISPLTVSLTGDNPCETGGLAYSKENTDFKNRQMVHDYYKGDFGIELPLDTEIVFGAGTTMLVAALYYALSKKLNKTITASTNTDIYYLLHQELTTITKGIDWEDHVHTDLSVIVSPNNPLGIITEPKDVTTEYMLYDVVYDKPLFSGNFYSSNKTLYTEFEKNKNIFITTSFSKMGIPGVRCGFLITRDPDIAKYIREYTNIISTRYPTAAIAIGRIAFYKYFQSHEWQLKHYRTLKKRQQDFFMFAKQHGINIMNVTTLVPFIYTDKSVPWWLNHFNVETRAGSDFNDTNDHSRFNLMISEVDWKEFMRRFAQNNN